MRLAKALCVALVIGAGIAPAASAHNLKESPGVGDSATAFKFRGTKWQPRGQVFAQYYASAGATNPFKTFAFRAGGNGKFIFRLTLPVSTVAFGLNQRMCFTQFDTRFAPRAAGTAPGKRFRKCKRFYVEPPTARFWPSSGPPGTAFLFVTSGWYPGQNLTLELTRPDGVLETYTDFSPTRLKAAYVAVGPPFGRVFVRRGGALRIFPGDPNVLQGTYNAVLRASNGGAEIRTAVTVTPP
jgi:hypothetical protein